MKTTFTEMDRAIEKLVEHSRRERMKSDHICAELDAFFDGRDFEPVSGWRYWSWASLTETSLDDVCPKPHFYGDMMKGTEQ